MIFSGYTKTDLYYEFTSANGEKYIIPSADVALVDDGSGVLSIKNTASRCTVGIVPKN